MIVIVERLDVAAAIVRLKQAKPNGWRLPYLNAARPLCSAESLWLSEERFNKTAARLSLSA